MNKLTYLLVVVPIEVGSGIIALLVSGMFGSHVQLLVYGIWTFLFIFDREVYHCLKYLGRKILRRN